MLVLGLDTALQRCSVAILRGSDVVADFGEELERGHAEHLAPMAAAALKKAGVGIRDLDRVGVVVGPGGFTGVRVALAFARGLAIGTGLPVVGVTSLAALAANMDAAAGALRAPVIDARRGQVYGALYEHPSRPLLEPFVATPEEALRCLVEKAGERPVFTVGSGVGLLPLQGANWHPSKARAQIDAKAVARLAADAPPPDGLPRPLYLRPPDAKPAVRPSLFPEGPQLSRWTVRRAGPGDADALVALEAQSFSSPGSSPGSGWGAKDVRASLEDPASGVVLLACDEAGTPEGFAIWRPLGEDAELLAIGVQPGARRRSAGAALVERVCQGARAGGARRLLLEVDVRNQAALTLYRMAGFERLSVRKRYYRDGADAMVMQFFL